MHSMISKLSSSVPVAAAGLLDEGDGGDSSLFWVCACSVEGFRAATSFRLGEFGPLRVVF
jgi:hypothetical protein